jgi:hypothetical protein
MGIGMPQIITNTKQAGQFLCPADPFPVLLIIVE